MLWEISQRRRTPLNWIHLNLFRGECFPNIIFLIEDLEAPFSLPLKLIFKPVRDEKLEFNIEDIIRFRKVINMLCFFKTLNCEAKYSDKILEVDKLLLLFITIRSMLTSSLKKVNFEKDRNFIKIDLKLLDCLFFNLTVKPLLML